jgi:predicted RecB family nuclease
LQFECRIAVHNVSDYAYIAVAITHVAEEKDKLDKKHVSLLSGLRTETREDFAKAGIQSLDQLVVMTPEELRKFRGIKTTAHGMHAHARAWVEERAVWYGALHPTCRSAAIYFDIETIPVGNIPEVWSIGWALDNGPVQVVMVDAKQASGYVNLPTVEPIMLVPDAGSAWHFFADSVSDSDLPIFHWTSYDSGNLKKYGPPDVAERLLPRLHDLHKFFNQAVKLPVKGSSLKDVGGHLGFKWRVYADYMAAYLDYQEWLRRRSLNGLASASAYQQDDITAMIVVRKWLAENEERA